MAKREDLADCIYRIEMLGGLRVSEADRFIQHLQPHRPAALLAFIAYHAERTHSREELTEVLWPETDPVVGRNRLKQTLSALREELGAREEDPDGILIANRNTIRLNDARVITDISAFRSAHSRAAALPPGPGRLCALESAQRLYRGPLLPGFYEEWVTLERFRLAEMYTDGLLALARLHQEAGRYADALDCAHKSVVQDPLREEGHCILMHLYASMGRSSDSIRQFYEMEHILQREIGESPSRECIELLHAIREGRVQTIGGLQSPANLHIATWKPASLLEPIGGAVPLESEYYIERPADAEFSDALARRDSIVLVQGPRQIGKTSLLARGLEQARTAGARVFLTDLQRLTTVQMQSADMMFLTLAESLAEQAELEVSVRETWDLERGWNVNFERFLRRELLTADPAPVVWGLDEIDRLFPLPFGSEVFGLFRSWHNLRSLHPAGPWSRFTLAMVYATEAHLFITDINQSPFNVGTRLSLEDFTIGQVTDLNMRYGSPLKTSAELIRYYAVVGGCPYLVRRGLHEMVTRRLHAAEFEAAAYREDGPYRDHLRRLLGLISGEPALVQSVRQALDGQTCSDSDSFYRLRSAGVLCGASEAVRFRCDLYRAFLQGHLP